MHRLVDSEGDAANLSTSMIAAPAWEQPRESEMNPVAAVWRYRWAVILPGILGAIIGFVIYLQMPDVYRSTCRLIVESNRSPVLDEVTGEMISGVPNIDIVRSQLFSDGVISRAYRDARMLPFHDQYPNGLPEFVAQVITDEALTLEPEFADVKVSTSLVMLIHFESENGELCEAAVKAFSDALQEYYNEKHKSSRSSLLGYMATATERLYPEMREMKERYRDFRRDAPLQWDSNGSAVNPHRNRQTFLIDTRARVQEKFRQVQSDHAAMEAILESTEDAEVAIAVIAQLLDKPYVLPNDRRAIAGFGDEDTELSRIRIERDLVPLIVQLSRMTVQYGEEHPSVKALQEQVEGLREQFGKLVEEETERVAELLDMDEQRAKEAAQALEAISTGLNTQLQAMQAQLKSLDEEIAFERAKASELAVYELQNEDLLAELEAQRSLMDQVQDMMSRVELTEEESGTRVEQLSAPSAPMLVSPIIWINMGIGTLLGLALGSGLALLLEKNSNTFRKPEEIVEVVGAPILTHLPFFKGGVRKGRKNEINAYEALDPRLAVLHSPASITAEAVRSCRTSMVIETSGIEGGKIIQITSPLPGDGKSTIAGNLACSIAQSGKSTVIVDCDLRRPQISENFGVSDKKGLTDLLDGQCELIDAIHDTPIATLKIMSSGPIPANPAEALTLPDMSRVLEMLREKFEYVIIDSPPLLLVTDPSILASYADGVILAIKVRRKSKPNTKEAVNILNAVRANILGVVVNNSDDTGKSDGYQGHGFYRYGRHAGRDRRSDRAYGRSTYYSKRSKNEGQQLVVSGRASHDTPAATADAGAPSNGQPPQEA